MIDVQRLRGALAGPGMDTRSWVERGTVTRFSVDSQIGALADVTLLPSLRKVTAQVGAIYLGNGFGLYAPLRKDDDVLVLVPEGKFGQGCVIVGVLGSKAAKPHPEFVANPQDLVLVAADGANVMIRVQGEGNIVLQADAGKVYLGGSEDTEPAAMGTTLKTYMNSIKAAFDSHAHVSAAPGSPTTTPVTPPAVPLTFPATPDVESKKSEVR